MRRYWRLISKSIVFIGIFSVLFKISCDRLVDILISVSSFSIVNMMDTNGDLTYEQFINAWVANGQYLRSERLTTEHIEKRNDLQLIGAQIIFRHGARTPLFLLPNLEEVN